VLITTSNLVYKVFPSEVGLVNVLNPPSQPQRPSGSLWGCIHVAIPQCVTEGTLTVLLGARIELDIIVTDDIP
jgi:hypothetical protein